MAVRRLFDPSTHSLSVYIPPEERFHIELAQILVDKFEYRSVGELIRALLKKGLQDNGLLDAKGRSKVKGIGPKPTKEALLKRVSLKLK